MELSIKKKKIKQPIYKNCYKVHITYMIGDADGSDYDTLYIDENDKHLHRFVKCLHMCKMAFDHGGMGGYDTHTDVPDYNFFFNTEYSDIEHDEETNISANHPNQPDDYGIETSFEDYEITYFDENSNEFPVEVNFTQEEKEEMRLKLKKSGYSVAQKW